MIRLLKKEDFDAAAALVNAGWRQTYAGYVNPALLREEGCAERARALRADFESGRLAEYVWEESGKVLALLSMGSTADAEPVGAFEIWRLYVTRKAQGRGIGGRMLAFAEAYAWERGFSVAVIWAFRENRRAVAFYQKYGYQIEREEALGEPYFADGVRLLKHLSR